MAQARNNGSDEAPIGLATGAQADLTTSSQAPGDGQPLHAAISDDGARGLKVGRFFTREGIHPYDELEWELRDAVITNWRDGSISFEQRGVEFPASWSLNATTIVAQKYFRGQLGTPRRERSVRQMVDRVADTITAWGTKDGYFADEESAAVFNHELKHLLVNQKMAFNSPVWFNVGVEKEPQCSACFILAVEDTMGSILNWYVEEGLIFKGGSGSGVNLSTIRSSKEQLSGGGEPSGPVSFMRGADASAGTIRSGGKTRRAAKMVILNVDHPDVEEFIWCKAREERKIRVLRESGFDMDLDSPDYASIQYQNANNSVRVTDEFMRAWENDEEYGLRAVTSGDVIERKKARDVMRQIAQAAWECADPGMQFDTTINRWHTCPESGRINASNPCCFVAETLVETSEGLLRFDVLEKRARAGQELPQVRAYDREAGEHVWRRVTNAWVAGQARNVVEVVTTGGVNLRCTPEHRFLLSDGRYVEAQLLDPGMALRAVGPDGDRIDHVSRIFRIVLPEPVTVFDLEVEGTHNFAVADDGAFTDHAVIAHNSEYMHLDNSACNLASLNLKKFYDYEAGRFDVEAYKRAIELTITAQEIIVGNSSYPTDKIRENALAFRELGLGYANLGGLLMSLGLPYDSDEGRAWCGALTALMTGHAYRTSAEIAKVTGPFSGYARNAGAMLRVIQMHGDEAEKIDPRPLPGDLLGAAKQAWKEADELGAEHGFRNSQATVLAPTGCLVGGTLVPTEHGLVRLASLGDPAGERWQDLGIQVATDEGPRQATHFYVNGPESVVTVSTARGYRLRGTPRHRVKVVTDTGQWVWRRFGELQPGDRVPLALGQLVDEPQRVELPALPDSDGDVVAPEQLTSRLAWLVGCVLSAGSVRDGSVGVHLPADDFERVEQLRLAGKELFGVEAQVSRRGDRVDVVFASTRLATWWETCGFAGARSPSGARVAQVPDAVLHSNDREVYAAFLGGLFPAGAPGHATARQWSTTSEEFCDEVQTLLLALGAPSTRRVRHDATGGKVAVLDVARHVLAQDDEADLVGADRPGHRQADVAPVPPARWLLDTVVSAALGDDELTYDLSVPDNVTYLANGFVSHNTIGLVMDCDTTGIEPDLGLVKTKKLVGGGSMSIVNRTVPQALRHLGYNDEQIEAIVAHIDTHKTIEGAPALRDEHLPVFQCAMGDNAIHYMGHVKMMAAAQPFISGALSKTVNMPESVTVEDMEQLFYDAWQLGIKAIAIYRDNCKVAQPLSVTKTDSAQSPVQAPAIETRERMIRRKLPKQRPSQTISFRVADAEGYLTAGEYPGDGLGEIFVKLGKQGSTLSGVMDAFAISVSLGLQYGVPLEVYVQKFMNMRFEPAGMTDDEEIRFATSIIDYLARKLAIEYLPADRRAELGVYTTDERTAALDAQYGGGATGASAEAPLASPPPADALPVGQAADSPATYDADAPLCYSCGTPMVRAGSCHLCEQCGATSGCS